MWTTGVQGFDTLPFEHWILKLWTIFFASMICTIDMWKLSAGPCLDEWPQMVPEICLASGCSHSWYPFVIKRGNGKSQISYIYIYTYVYIYIIIIADLPIKKPSKQGISHCTFGYRRVFVRLFNINNCSDPDKYICVILGLHGLHIQTKEPVLRCYPMRPIIDHIWSSSMSFFLVFLTLTHRLQ